MYDDALVAALLRAAWLLRQRQTRAAAYNWVAGHPVEPSWLAPMALVLTGFVMFVAYPALSLMTAT